MNEVTRKKAKRALSTYFWGRTVPRDVSVLADEVLEALESHGFTIVPVRVVNLLDSLAEEME